MQKSSIVMEPDISEWTMHYGSCQVYGQEEANRRPLSLRAMDQARTMAPVGVLIIDDNRLNGAAMRRSFSALKSSAPIFEVRTCGEALDALRGEHSRISALPPCVLVLNLDMPGSFELLTELRLDPDHAMRRLTVFVHSESNSISNRNRAYECDIAGYIHDRPGRKSFLNLARILRRHLMAIEFSCHDEPIGCDHVPANVWPSPIPFHRTVASTRLELVI